MADLTSITRVVVATVCGAIGGIALWSLLGNLTSSYSAGSTNGSNKKPGEIPNCQICLEPIVTLTIEWDCGHTFHDECYSTWRSLRMIEEPHARPCPICQSEQP